MLYFLRRYLHTSKHPNSKLKTITFLTQILHFPKPRAILYTNKFTTPNTPSPNTILTFLSKSLNYPFPVIHSWVTKAPQILFSDIETTLKPNIKLFQEMGLKDIELKMFLDKNPSYLTSRFEERLLPCLDIVKKIDKNVNLVKLLERCNWGDVKDPVSRISSNVAFLEECGIVGSQLVTVIVRQPRLLIMGEGEVRGLVGKLLGMGFSVGSRMFVHGLYTLSCLSEESFGRKVGLFREFGFSEGEVFGMFKKAPGLLRVSEVKLRSGIEFFVNVVGFDKEVLVKRPSCLMFSLENRVVPRFSVVNVMMEKRVLRKRPKFLNVMWVPEAEFLEKYIYKDRDYAEELLLVYKGHHLIAAKEENTV